MKRTDERPRLPYYDPDFCGKVVKVAACVCVALIVAELLVLFLVHPSGERCPGWIFHPNQPSATSLWLLAAMLTVVPSLWISHVALRWDHYYQQKMYDSIAHSSWVIDADRLTLLVMAGWCLFCAIPFFLMLVPCTALSRYLKAVHF